jgi:hypothetical protein
MVKVGNGRPTSKNQIKLKQELQKYFNEGRSKTYTVKHSKHAKDTVDAYWKEFRNTYITELDESFVARQRAAREAALGAIDEEIDASDEEVLKAKALRDELESIPAHGMYIKALEHQNFLIRKRAAMDMVPTVDVNIDNIIAEEVHGHTGTGDNKRKD